jgi:hypothetical protein
LFVSLRKKPCLKNSRSRRRGDVHYDPGNDRRFAFASLTTIEFNTNKGEDGESGTGDSSGTSCITGEPNVKREALKPPFAAKKSKTRTLPAPGQIFMD